MKFSIKRLLATVALMLGISSFARAGSTVVYSQNLVNETALAYNTTYTLDLGISLLPRSNIASLSMQAVYSSATIPTVTITDGVKSTGTITVSSYPALVGAQGTNTLTVATNTALTGVSFFLNGMQFQQGDLWAIGASSAATAINIATAINGFAPASALVSASTTSLGVVTMTCVSSGVACNAITLTATKTSLKPGAARFTGGRNQGFLVINGTILTQGTNFNAVTNASTTAKNISDAIQGNSTLSAIIASTWTAAGVVPATSTAVGSTTNYGWFSSSSAALSCSNNRLYGGSDSAINVTTDKITSALHGLTLGLAVRFDKVSGTTPTGLTDKTTYYAIPVDTNNFKLATSQANALAGTAVDITAITGSGSFTLTPVPLTGTPSFKWQYSNDNVNFSDVAVSSVTMTSLAPASTIWDFGAVNYRFLRLNVVAPTKGGISLVVTGVGRSN